MGASGAAAEWGGETPTRGDREGVLSQWINKEYGNKNCDWTRV